MKKVGTKRKNLIHCFETLSDGGVDLRAELKIKNSIFTALLILPSLSFAYEINLICKSKFQELEAEVYLNDTAESWIIVPPSLKSPIAKDTKRKITKFELKDEYIEGVYKTDGIILKDRFVINRQTGSINFDGYNGTFSGVCEKKDNTVQENKF